MIGYSKIKVVAVLVAGLAISVCTVSATLVLDSRTLVSENNQNFNISVFDGKARFDNTGTLTTNPPLFEGTLGNGTVTDYKFFHSPGGAIASYASSSAGLISDAVTPAANINGAGENWSNVWTTSDPDSAPKDFNNGTVPNTFARSAEVDGTIDISGMTSGTIYIPHGTFINQWAVTLTMSGLGQVDQVAVDEDTVNGPGTNMGWISQFSFSDAALFDTISYNYTNADRDGSRARFMGVILTPTVIPEPSTFSLGLVGLMMLAACRRLRQR